MRRPWLVADVDFEQGVGVKSFLNIGANCSIRFGNYTEGSFVAKGGAINLNSNSHLYGNIRLVGGSLYTYSGANEDHVAYVDGRLTVQSGKVKVGNGAGYDTLTIQSAGGLSGDLTLLNGAVVDITVDGDNNWDTIYATGNITIPANHKPKMTVETFTLPNPATQINPAIAGGTLIGPPNFGLWELVWTRRGSYSTQFWAEFGGEQYL